MTVEDETTTTTTTVAPLTLVAFAVAWVAVILLFTVSRADAGVVLAGGIASLVLSVLAGTYAAREHRGGVGFARAGSIISVLVVIATIVWMTTS